jgi:superfamily I DNA and/or RNA helicase
MLSNKLKKEQGKLETIDRRTKNKKEWKKIQKDILGASKMVFATLGVTGSRKFEDLKFDYLIVDEAC